MRSPAPSRRDLQLLGRPLLVALQASRCPSALLPPLARYLEMPESYRGEGEVGSRSGKPAHGYGGVWPGRPNKPARDAIREEKRRWDLLFLSMLFRYGLTTTEFAARWQLNPETLSECLKGEKWTRTAERQEMMRALLQEALEMGESPPDLLRLLDGGGPLCPQGAVDPVWHLRRGHPRWRYLEELAAVA